MALHEILRHTLLRRLPFFLYLGMVVALAGAVIYFGWERTWSSVHVPPMYPPFADLRLIQGAVSSVDHGYDPRIVNWGDPWQRAFNYPMLWITIGKTLNFTNEHWFIAACLTMVLCFVAVCGFLVFSYPSFGLLASLISTSTLLGIERGNNDLVVFCLLFLAALIPKRWSFLPLLLATLLKLYPVFAIGAAFIKRQFTVFAASLAGAVAIFTFLRGQLAVIRWKVPVNCAFSYGSPSIIACVRDSGWPLWTLWFLFAVVGSVTLALAYYFSKSDSGPVKNDSAFDLMLIGALVYIGTFMLSSNWDYRLIFLILCIPFLQRRPFPFAHIIIGVILLAMNEAVLVYWFGLSGQIMVQLAKITIFAVLSGYLLARAWAALTSVVVKPRSMPATPS